MAVSFPLTVNEFWEKLPVSEFEGFDLKYNGSKSIDGAGNIYESRVAGSGRWAATVRCDMQYFADVVKIEALVRTIMARQGTFFAYDLRNPYPAEDPDGSIIDGETVQIKSKGSNNRSIALKGLTNGYVLTRGDRLSVSIGGSATALLEVAENVTATIAGETAEFEISPIGLPTALAVNQTVDLIKPPAKCRIMPGSFKPSTGSGNLSSGMSFTIYSILT